MLITERALGSRAIVSSSRTMSSLELRKDGVGSHLTVLARLLGKTEEQNKYLRAHGEARVRAAQRCFTLGVKMEIVGQNVYDFADPSSPQRSEARAPSPDDIGALLDAARGSRWSHFVELALLSGGRRGELLALTWDDVDLEVGQMMIRASLSQTKGATTIKVDKDGPRARCPADPGRDRRLPPAARSAEPRPPIGPVSSTSRIRAARSSLTRSAGN